MAHTSEYDAVTVGEAMVLVTPQPLGPLRTALRAEFSVAGAEATVARYLAILGHRTTWVSAVGDDPFGHRILDEMASSGVDASHVRIDPGAPTGVFFKDPRPDGGTSVHYYRMASAASFMTAEAVQTIKHETRLLHVSGITAALSASCRDLVRDLLIQRTAGGSLISFDVNYRPRLWTREDAADALLALANAADVVFVGLDEARELWAAHRSADVRAKLPRPGQLIVKDAEVGATLFYGDHQAMFEPARPVEVVEAVGAGDAFAAGYLHGWLLGLGARDRLRLGHLLAGASLRVTSDFGPLPDGIPRADRRVGDRRCRG
jgi:2-dehydro-3-deoxygluconokinase